MTSKVAILETGKQITLAIGVLNELCQTVEYYTDGSIFDTKHKEDGRGTKGILQQRINKLNELSSFTSDEADLLDLIPISPLGE